MLDSTQSESFTAALTRDDVAKAEKIVQSNVRIRRAALFLLTRGSADIRPLNAEKIETFRLMQEHLSEYQRWREHETELLRAAQARLDIILQDCDLDVLH